MNGEHVREATQFNSNHIDHYNYSVEKYSGSEVLNNIINMVGGKQTKCSEVLCQLGVEMRYLLLTSNTNKYTH